MAEAPREVAGGDRKQARDAEAAWGLMLGRAAPTSQLAHPI